MAEVHLRSEYPVLAMHARRQQRTGASMTLVVSHRAIMPQNGYSLFKLVCSFCTCLWAEWPADAQAQFAVRFPWSQPSIFQPKTPAFPSAPIKTQPVSAKPRIVDLFEVKKEDLRTKQLRSVAREVSVEAALQLDPTLRRGDIAVLSSGLHVFRGQTSAFHGSDDFQPLAKSDLRRRSDLAAIQKVGLYQANPSGGFIAITTVRPIGRISELRPKVGGGFKTISAPALRF
jgi:hypothetical protein